MFLKMQNRKSILGYGFHYSGAAAILTGVSAITAPWILPLASGISISEKIIKEKKVRDITEKQFKQHPNSHRFSPNLKKMVNTLYKNSKLDHQKTEIFDYDIDIPNAGFLLKMGKTMIVVSSALLEALDDDEEFAVLAHEFAHATARHHRSVIPYDLMNNIAKTSASLAVISEAVSTGGMEIAISTASSLAVGVGVKKHFPQHKKTAVAAFGITAFGALSYFNPVFLATFAASQGVKITSVLLGKSFSRTREYQADKGAVTLGASPLALITSLRKMEQIQEGANPLHTSLRKNIVFRALENYFGSHPQTEKRIQRLVKIARAQNKYSEAEINNATTGELTPFNVDRKISRGTLVQTKNRFIGNPNPIKDAYNEASTNFKENITKLVSFIPQVNTLKIN